MTLEIKSRITNQKWLSLPETTHLMNTLQGGIPKEEPQALFVGGCVRNSLLGELVDDIDIATILTPEEVSQILEKEEVKVIPTGVDHGTVTAIVGDRKYEITTLRKDIKTDGRHAEVIYSSSWEEDAKRRDFTMNTLLMDIDGNIYDPLGCGLGDLETRTVKFVGDAGQRIKEDYLRILRFFRFSALYGDDFDQNALYACKKQAENIKSLSKERVAQEFFKIIASDNPRRVLDVMFENNVLEEIKFLEYDPDLLEHFCTFQSRYKLNAVSSRLYVFAGMNLDNIKSMEKFIIFPKIFLKDMKFISGALNLSDLSCDHAVKVSVYRFGRSITAQTLMMELANDRVMNGYAPKALDIIQNWDVPIFPVSGHDLVKKGIPEGPELGRELDRLEQEWIDGGFSQRFDHLA